MLIRPYSFMKNNKKLGYCDKVELITPNNIFHDSYLNVLPKYLYIFIKRTELLIQPYTWYYVKASGYFVFEKLRRINLLACEASVSF